MSQQSERGSTRQEPADGQPPESERRRPRFGLGAWMASTAVQTIVVLVGLAVVLFAVGQAVGADVLGTVAGALTTHTGQWLAVAFVALIVIGAALRAMSVTYPRW